MGESCGVNGRDPSIRYGSIEMMMHRSLNITAYRYRRAVLGSIFCSLPRGALADVTKIFGPAKPLL
jgi:hypothetical protein